MHTVLCLRRYRKYEGLYDAVFKVATLGEPDQGLASTLVLQGVSFENARRIAQRYLGAIRWKP